MKNIRYKYYSGIFTFFLICSCNISFAQSSFEDFKRQREEQFNRYKNSKQKEFDEYRNRINQEFADYMRSRWDRHEVKQP
ncbi:MAG: hypothetical protein K2G85_09175, partial [Muribaculaceae bacterium]|nr:hypothetical protein [Muribaculaceae bacterium]